MYILFSTLFCITALSQAMELQTKIDTFAIRYNWDAKELNTPPHALFITHDKHGLHTIEDIRTLLNNNPTIQSIAIEYAPDTQLLAQLPLQNISSVNLFECSNIQAQHFISVKKKYSTLPRHIFIHNHRVKPYFHIDEPACTHTQQSPDSSMEGFEYARIGIRVNRAGITACYNMEQVILFLKKLSISSVDYDGIDEVMWSQWLAEN